jgi:hypothetical protein
MLRTIIDAVEQTVPYLPAVYPDRLYVAGGGLFSAGINVHDLYAKGGKYAGQIIRAVASAGSSMPTPMPTPPLETTMTLPETTLNYKVAKNKLGKATADSLAAMVDYVFDDE